MLQLAPKARLLDDLRVELASADEVRIAVAFTRCSGVGLLQEALSDAARRGRVRVLTSTYQQVTQPDALVALAEIEQVQSRLYDGPRPFHTKFWWRRRGEATTCWVGSSNLTRGGLVSNIEWNVRSDASQQAAEQFEALWGLPASRDLDAAQIERYRRVYEAAQASRVLVAAEPLRTWTAPNAAQVEALAALATLRSQGARRAAIVAATGVGKTLLAAFDAQAAGARQVLFVAHRQELLEQARAAFAQVRPEVSGGVLHGQRDESSADQVFATIQTLRNRPDLLARAWDYLVVDEFHHVEARSYEALTPVRERAFTLGLTATPERLDGRDVLAWCDHQIAYEVRLPEAVERRWLLPFHYYGVADDETTFPSLRGVSEEALATALSVERRAEAVWRAARRYGFDGPARVTVGFCAGRAHANFMADAFRRRGEVAEAVLGDMPVAERRALYRRLEDPTDPLRWLFVADVLNEGVDLPAINCLLFLRPTESPTIFLQQLGRGLRLTPGVEVLTVLDFVGHHDRAWVALHALHTPHSGQPSVAVGERTVTPPAGCEIVLEAKTQQILEKVKRFVRKRDALEAGWRQLRAELGRAPLPSDLLDRTDLPTAGDYRSSFGSWLGAQRALGDEPAWAAGLADDHPAAALLRAVESDWQAPRVAAYAYAWALAVVPDDPEAGYDAFFARWPYLAVERQDLGRTKTRASVEAKLGAALADGRLRPEIAGALGPALVPEVEGRLWPTILKDYRTRHLGVLRSPEDLRVGASYERPAIINHFGVQYDPARHNTGVVWFDGHVVLMVRLDPSGAKAEHQYHNAMIGDDRFLWTSQNRMGPTDGDGARILADGIVRHLFVAPKAHEPSVYLGRVEPESVEGERPMRVVWRLLGG